MSTALRTPPEAPPVARWLPDALDRLRIRHVPILMTCPSQLRETSTNEPIDLLVPPSRFHVAARTLSALGFVEPSNGSSPWPSFDRALREGTHFVREDGASIDLAHHLRPWVWGERLSFAELYRRGEAAQLDGVSIRSVDTDAAVVIAALRLVDAGENGRLAAFMALAAACDPTEVARLARATRLEAVVAAIVARLLLRSPPVNLLDALAASSPSLGDAVRLRGLLAGRRGTHHPLVSALALPVPKAAAYLGTCLVPAPEVLERRFGSRYAYPEWWKQTIGVRRAPPGHAGPPSTYPSEVNEAGPPIGGFDRLGHAAVLGRRRLHHVTTLFPDIDSVTAATLFYGVEGAPAVPTDAAAWDDEIDVLLQHRLSGLALAAADRWAVRLSPDARARLHEGHMRNVARTLAVESTVANVLDMLGARSIPFVVTKGPGIALSYPRPTLRPYGDLDVLVPPNRFEEGMASLSSLGFEEYFRAGEPRSYFDRYCREGVNMIRSDGASIDLHHRIPPWVWGARLEFRRLLESSREVELAGGRIRVLDPIHNMLVAALHVISDRRDQPGSKLMTWRDVVSLARTCDPGAVVSEAQRLELDWYLAFVLRQLPSAVRPRELVERLGHPLAKAGDAFRLRRLLPPALGSKHQIAQVFRLPAPNAVAFMGGYIVPSRVFLRKRYGGDGTYVRWWREATGRLRDARDVSLDGLRGER